ncbi:MraY family glycosyltransferase, partial [Gaiella sp.]|uniref:MraY family glycosyltransferase n=1 Tax=Gaiella sp. TaxID=2663207 RepID=UPI003263B518
MNLVVAIAAAPIAFLTIAGLLHWPRALTRFGADPRPDRWHTSPTPAFGGIGIFAGFVAAVAAATALGPVGIPGELFAVIAGGAIVFGFGLLDDIVQLHPAAKLGAQLAAAIVIMQSSISVEFVSNSALGWALGIVWLVGLTNAFNLLDNMDGLAGSLGIVAASCFALSAAFVAPNRDIFIVAMSLALALVGFIPYNLRLSGPARVFMGDSGSQLIGLVLATLGLMASYKEAGTTIATLALPVLILAVPILDTTLVTALRLRS